MFENLNMASLLEAYALPWGINIVLALVIFVAGRVATKIITRVIRKLLVRADMDDMLVNFVCSILKTALLLFVIIAALAQLGVDTTSLIALLGAAGLAIGLALKDSLQNFASGVMLIIFRPFRAGDFVEAAGISGTVEEIGIFSTQMRTGDNREIIIPNGNIYSGTITNYSARDTRRIDMVFGIGYDDDIRKTRDILQNLVDNDARILKDPKAQIAVSELADSSVNFIVRPWVKRDDYWSVKFDMNESVKLAFDENGISIPFPQMQMHMARE